VSVADGGTGVGVSEGACVTIATWTGDGRDKGVAVCVGNTVGTGGDAGTVAGTDAGVVTTVATVGSAEASTTTSGDRGSWVVPGRVITCDAVITKAGTGVAVSEIADARGAAVSATAVRRAYIVWSVPGRREMTTAATPTRHTNRNRPTMMNQTSQGVPLRRGGDGGTGWAGCGGRAIIVG